LFSTRTQNLIVLLTCLLLLILAFAFYGSQPLLSDVSYFVAADQRILHGAVPYIDIYENNPPLAFWFTLPPVWVAEQFGLRPELVFVFYVLVLAAGILALVWAIHSQDVRGNFYRQKLILILAVVTTFCLAFGFGQREYFATLLLLPYISAVALRGNGQTPPRRFEILHGFLLGIGICFKPYFLLIPIGLEIYLLIKTHNWKNVFRSEILTAAALVLFYPALIWWVYPTYFATIVPLTILTYGAFQASYSSILLSSTFIVFLLPFMVTISILALTKFQDQGALVWMIAALAGLAIHFSQHMGWPYHLLPGLAFITVAFLLAALHLRKPILQMLACFSVLACIGPGLIDYSSSQELRLSRFDHLLKEQHPQRMMILTYDLGAAFPYLPAHNIEWVGHYQSLWPMVAVSKNKVSDADGKDVLTNMAHILALDLTQQSPDFVIIDHRPFSDRPEAGDENPINRLGAFAEFTSAWANYKMVKEDGAFQLWQRQ
jgi:hypothetical protein